MADSEKPFACSSPGCNMSFTNEDHLVVHKKKHDMVLNLGAGAKSGAFVADQTPTPTRFIRNCEEVGLFQDLQNVNPFEETFRRAVESGKIGSLPESELTCNDDTLHTPHVFPHIEDVSSPCSRVEIVTDVLENPNNEDGIHGNNGNRETIKKTTESIVIQEADTSYIPPVLTSTPSFSRSINGEEVQLLLKTHDGSLVQLSAIPVNNFPNNNINNNDINVNNQNNDNSDNIISNNHRQESKPQTIVRQTTLAMKNLEPIQIRKSSSSRLSLAKMRLRQALTKNGAREKTDRMPQHSRNINKRSMIESEGNKSDDTYEDVAKKQEILERNRASSMRARAKRKEWIQQLERTVNNVNAINATLQLEINSLQTEVSKLKTILLAHNDCSVTKAMEKGTGVIIKSEMNSMPSQFLQSTSISSDSCTVHGIKRNLIINDIPIASKKKSLMLPTVKSTKQSILLPKTNDKTLPIVTKIFHKDSGTPIIKLIDLNDINDNKRIEAGNPILIVQNNGSIRETKIQVINTQEIVNIDQSLQLINVASKTTGT